MSMKHGAFWKHRQHEGDGEKDQGTVRFGVMGQGCVPQAWSPVVDPNVTRPCVAGYQVTWKEQSQCTQDNCVYKCITNRNCTHVWDDYSERCRNCKLACSDFWSQYASKQSPPFDSHKTTSAGSRSSGDWNAWAYNLRHAVTKGHSAEVAQLRQYRWCKYF